jgi:hypothetical protein
VDEEDWVAGALVGIEEGGIADSDGWHVRTPRREVRGPHAGAVAYPKLTAEE